MQTPEILHSALSNLEQLLPIRANWKAGRGPAEGQLTFKMQGEEHCMDVELKRDVKTNMLPRLFEQTGCIEHFMVVA